MMACSGDAAALSLHHVALQEQPSHHHCSTDLLASQHPPHGLSISPTHSWRSAGSVLLKNSDKPGGGHHLPLKASDLRKVGALPVGTAHDLPALAASGC